MKRTITINSNELLTLMNSGVEIEIAIRNSNGSVLNKESITIGKISAQEVHQNAYHKFIEVDGVRLKEN